MFKTNSAVEYETLEPYEGLLLKWLPFLRWTSSSPAQLKTAEENILTYQKTPSEGFYVNVGNVNGSPCKIWTRVYNCDKSGDQAPLVMMHGMGAGSALWALNIDTLCLQLNR